MQNSLGDEIFFTGFKWDASSFNDEAIAALDDYHVFVVVIMPQFLDRSKTPSDSRPLRQKRNLLLPGAS